MDQLMTRRGGDDGDEEGDLASLLPDVHLRTGTAAGEEERLQVHMDCMNAAGEVVAIEDVDDMGGAVSLFELSC